jgi:hypothetical protein
MKTIDKFHGEFDFLSNFYETEINIFARGSFPSAENAYQSYKCKNEKDVEQFKTCTAGKAKRLGQKVEIREDWDKVKIMIMTLICTLKFSQNQDLESKLLATGDSLLVEGNTWGDKFWGACEGYGENNLGIILMNIREDLRDLEA